MDGVIIWDMVCGTIGRPCPKAQGNTERWTDLGDYRLPPPCIYLMPATVPDARNNPKPKAQNLEDVEILAAFNACFGGHDEEINFIDFEVGYKENDTVRATTIRRGGKEQKVSEASKILR